MDHKIWPNCSILGHDVGRIFGVRVLDSQPVDELKDGKLPEHDHIAAYTLDIYKVGAFCATYPPLLMCSDTLSAPESPLKR